MISGQFEMSDPGLVAGWAIDSSNPSTRLLVEIFLDDTKLGEAVAGSHLTERAEPQASGHPFRIALDGPVAADDRARIRAVITPVALVEDDLRAVAASSILQSGLFEPGFYGNQVGHDLSPPDMVRHYLSQGESEGARPHPLFDPAFVRDQFAAAAIGLSAGGVLATYLAHPDLDIDPHPLFDTSRLRRPSADSPSATGLRQYLETGARADGDENPCVLFDPAFYLSTNADVAQSGVDPLTHYAGFGGREGRAPHPLFLASHFREALDAIGVPHPADHDLLGFYLRAPQSWAASPHPLFDPTSEDASGGGPGHAVPPNAPPLVTALRDAALPPTRWFDEPFYSAQATRDGFSIEGPPLLHYLRHGVRLGLDPHPLFSIRRYLADHPDLVRFAREPLVHFLGVAGSGAAAALPGAGLAHAARRELLRSAHAVADRLSDPHPLFEARLYAARNPRRLTEDESPLAHYARAWGSNGLRFPPWGTALHPCRADPSGHGPYDVLFVSHELSRTGAPAILLKIIEDLTGRRGVRGLTLAWNSGVRLEDFREWTPVVDMAAIRASGLSDADFLEDLIGAFTPSARPRLVIANTACVDQISEPFAKAGIPVVTLVHEIASGFEAAVFERIYASSKRVIYPAAFVRDEAHRAHVLPSDRDAVAPQGLLEPAFGQLDPEPARRAVIAELDLPEDAVVVLGAGTLDLRKGVDVFVKVAAQTLRRQARDGDSSPIHFVWLGDGDRGQHSAFSYFMEDARRLGVAGQVHFPGARANPEPYFVASDLFMLPSRLDPFPCVVHEAMACAKPVVAFAGAGGAPEALADGAGVVVDYGDVDAMAAAVWELVRDPEARREVGERGKARVAREYVFTDYVDRLVGLIEEATAVDLGPPQRAPRRGRDERKRVLFTASRWEASARTAFVGQLVDGLNRRGFAAELVLTSRDPALRARDHLPDVPTTILPQTLQRPEPLRDAWRKLTTLLEGAGTAVFAPVFDDIAEALIPVAPAGVGVLEIAFDIDPARPERMSRLARYCQRIVAGSASVAEVICSLSPGSAGLLARIPWGVTAPTDTAPSRSQGPLRVLCRADGAVPPDLARTLRALIGAVSGRAIAFTLLGRLAARGQVEALFAGEIAAGRLSVAFPRGEAEESAAVKAHDVLLLLPGFEIEGLEVLSAMAAGLPLLAFSGDPAATEFMIETGNGFFVAPGDLDGVKTRLIDLAERPDRRALLSQGARETVRAGGFDLDRMCDRYAELLDEMFRELRAGGHVRPRPLHFHPELGGITLPPSLICHPDAVGWLR